MASTRDIRRRIKSVKNSRQITKAMELVAASKMGKAQQAAVAGKPFALLLAQIIDAVSHQIGEELTHPLLVRREVRTRGILLITTDRGLCGALNSNLLRLVSDITGPARFVCMGRKGAQFLSRTKRTLVAEFPLADKVTMRDIRPAADFLVDAFLEGRVDTVEVIYAQFVNTLTQMPVRVPLLPLTDLAEIVTKLRGPRGGPADELFRRDSREMAFEPSAVALLDVLLPLYLKGELFQCALSAKASEHSARMVAMKTAKDNASNLIEDLTLEYNKARQAAITAEILEISAAAAALAN